MATILRSIPNSICYLLRTPFLTFGRIERLSNANSVTSAVRKSKIPWESAVKVSCAYIMSSMASKVNQNPEFHLVCDYYVHEACQEFAVPNCVEKATFDAAKTLSDARNATTHHFQEGNLPNNSKCVKCKKGCWSPDCLTGMRCQWCGMSAHSSCVPNIPGALAVCQFGLLEPIFLPPAAISTPRIQYTSEKTVVTKSHALMQARKYFPLSNQISF